ncbi:MAG: NUDIX domain-containing protein [Candidatus Paceibacterota bacterium]
MKKPLIVDKPLDKIFLGSIIVLDTLSYQIMKKEAVREKKYKFAVIATDVVLFTVKDEKLQVLLIKMKKKLYKEHWALPGGLIKSQESLETAAKRNLLAKSGVKNIYLEQLRTFGDISRDPFGRVVSVAYFALIPYSGIKLKTTKKYAGINWFPIKKLPDLAYDHKKMIALAVKRLKAKLGYTNIVYSLLPQEFSLSDLQETYEIILNRKLDKRNFRKKILLSKLLIRTNKKEGGMPHRPAVIYRFKQRSPQIIDLL